MMDRREREALDRWVTREQPDHEPETTRSTHTCTSGCACRSWRCAECGTPDLVDREARFHEPAAPDQYGVEFCVRCQKPLCDSCVMAGGHECEPPAEVELSPAQLCTVIGSMTGPQLREALTVLVARDPGMARAVIDAGIEAHPIQTAGTAAERGFVATRSESGRVLLHLAAPGLGETTVCGRYDRDRYLPETEVLPADARECLVCQATAIRRGHQ